VECLVGKLLLVNPHTACGRKGRLPEHGSSAWFAWAALDRAGVFSGQKLFFWMGGWVYAVPFPGRRVGCERFASLLDA